MTGAVLSGDGGSGFRELQAFLEALARMFKASGMA